MGHKPRRTDSPERPSSDSKEATGNCRKRLAAALLEASERVLAAGPKPEESKAGVLHATWYAGFQARADKVKNDFLAFLLEMKREGKRVAAYGAAAKGNTLLNYAGVRPDLIPFVVDRNPAKQGKYLPGSRIPIVGEERLKEARPDCIVLLPWNLREEVMAQLAYARAWGARFVTAVPVLEMTP